MKVVIYNSMQEAKTNPCQLEAVSPYMYINIHYVGDLW